MEYKNITFSIGNTDFKIIFQGKYGHTDTSWYAPYHSHPFIEIHIMYSGSVKMISDSTDKIIKDGNLCIVPHGVFHAFEPLTASAQKTSVYLEIKQNKKKTADTYSHFLKLFNSNVPLVFEYSPTYLTETMKALNSSHDTNIILTAKIQSLFTFIMADVYESMLLSPKNEDGNEETDYASTLLLKIEGYLSSTPINDVTEDLMAKSLFISTSQLRRLIRKYFNCTFRSFILAQKIETAKYKIAEGKMTIEKIATSLGYETYSGFYRSFKSITGLTPEEFKNTKKL